MLLRQGDRSEDVRLLQEALTRRGFEVPTTGFFGEMTVAAVRRFQLSVDLKADGIVGSNTQIALYEPLTNESPSLDVPKPTTTYDAAAAILGCSVAAIEAIARVESKGNGFLPDGRPKILFERHVFYRQLSAHGLRPGAYTDDNICSTKPGGYLGGAQEYDRLEKAKEICREAALESASWGAFQVMGYHWRTLGYSSIDAFVSSMNTESGQLDSLVKFLQATPSIVKSLIQKDWASVARAYNGVDYAKNQYDVKLKTEYERLS